MPWGRPVPPASMKGEVRLFYARWVRRTVLVLSAACFLALCAPARVTGFLPAYAEMQEFEALSLDVPASWTAEQQGATVVLKAVSSDASLSLASGKMGEATLEEIAKKLYEQLGGVDLEEDEEGDFYFEYKDTAGVQCGVWVYAGDEGEYLVMASSGDDQPGGEMIEKILDSIHYRATVEPDSGDEDGEKENYDDENEEED